MSSPYINEKLLNLLIEAHNSNQNEIDLTNFSKVFIEETFETESYYTQLFDSQDGRVSATEYIQYTLSWLSLQRKKIYGDLQEFNYFIPENMMDLIDEFNSMKYLNKFLNIIE